MLCWAKKSAFVETRGGWFPREGEREGVKVVEDVNGECWLKRGFEQVGEGGGVGAKRSFRLVRMRNEIDFR
jgi:hypothetical protein